MVLAQVADASPDLTQWYVGLTIGFIVVVVAVVLVASILTLASRIGKQSRAGTAALDAARINTLALWDVETINNHLRAILEAARAARAAAEE